MTDLLVPRRTERATTEHAHQRPHTENTMLTQTITDPAADARRARLEDLQRRRATAAQPTVAPAPATPVQPASVARASRAGAAQGSKIAAAGFGFAAMLGLVGLMGFASRATGAAPAVLPVARRTRTGGGRDPSG